MKKLIYIIILLLTANIMVAYAISNHNENQTLHVYIINLTPDKLILNRIIKMRSGALFSINSNVINPSEQSVLTIEKFAHNDIEGRIIFINSSGTEVSLYILDQEQLHFGQAIFNVSGNQYYSNLTSKTRNPNIGPRYLTYIEASLQIFKQRKDKFFR